MGFGAKSYAKTVEKTLNIKKQVKNADKKRKKLEFRYTI